MAGNNDVFNTLTYHFNKTRAELQAATGYWLQFATGAVLVPTSALDGYGAWYLAATQMRDPATGALSTVAAVSAVLLAMVTSLVIAVSVHAMLSRLPKTIWARGAIWLGVIALIVTMAQPVLGTLQDPTAAGNSFDHSSGAGGVLHILMTLARSPIYAMAALTSGVGLYLVIDALKTRERVQRLKQDMVDGVAALADIAEGQNLLKHLKTEVATYDARMVDAVVDGVYVGLQTEADRIDACALGVAVPLDEEAWIRSIAGAITAHAPKSPELVRVIKATLPYPLPIALLAEDTQALSAAARAELARYSGWLRSHSRTAIRTAITQ